MIFGLSFQTKSSLLREKFHAFKKKYTLFFEQPPVYYVSLSHKETYQNGTLPDTYQGSQIR